MKNLFIYLLMFTLYNVPNYGQKLRREEIADKIEAQKVAFITNELNLTPEESQKFWPLYNEFSAKERELRPEIPPRKMGNLSEEEANKVIDKFFDNEEKRLNLTKNYYQKFKNILPASKIVKLHVAEMKFKEKLLERLKEKRDNFKREN